MSNVGIMWDHALKGLAQWLALSKFLIILTMTTTNYYYSTLREKGNAQAYCFADSGRNELGK